MSQKDIFPTRAMVLAAGLGTRMRPLTDHIPKPLVPVAGHTLIDRVLDWMQASQIKDVVVNSFYKAELLEAHLAKRALPKIHISREDPLLETGGGIKRALPLLGDGPFFSANSDTLCIDGTTPALQRLYRAWDDDAMDALLLLHPVDKAIGYEGQGDFFIDDNHVIRRRMSAPRAPYVFTGVQLLHPRLFAGAEEGAFSMNVLYNRAMSADGTLSRIRAVIHDGNWLHVGDPDGLRQAEQWLAFHRP